MGWIWIISIAALIQGGEQLSSIGFIAQEVIGGVHQRIMQPL